MFWVVGQGRMVAMLNFSPQNLLPSILIAFLTSTSTAFAADTKNWDKRYFYEIGKLSISQLPHLPPDVSNHVADDPKAASFGKSLFFDARLSANGAVSCSSCHIPEQQFQDGLRLGHGIADVAFRTPSLIGTSYQPFYYWNGRKDSQWSQALEPLESPLEHGMDRMMVVRLAATHYRAAYETVFGNLPNIDSFPEHASPLGNPEAVAAWNILSPEQQHSVNLTFANIGKSIAAFERTIPVPATRFDAFAAALAVHDFDKADKLFTESEENGFKLFVSKGNCNGCHDGPLFTNTRFFNIGLSGIDASKDAGRSTATFKLKNDPFNCFGAFSDAEQPKGCNENKLVLYDRPEQVGAFKVPSLRGVAQRAPFMHAGQFQTLHEVLQHYNKAPKATIGTSELLPLEFSEQELSDIEAFLRTLNSLE